MPTQLYAERRDNGRVANQVMKSIHSICLVLIHLFEFFLILVLTLIALNHLLLFTFFLLLLIDLFITNIIIISYLL